MKLAAFSAVWVAIFAYLSWLYSPSLELTVVSSAVLIMLAALTLWSASKLSTGSNFLVKIAVVAIAAGFMYSQAMDVGYSAYFAPAGGRFALLLETVSAAGILVLFALLGWLLLFRSEKKEQPDSNSR